MSTDAIVILKDNHQQIRKNFRDFQGRARTPQPLREATTRGRTKLQEMGACMPTSRAVAR
jgi:hypothetical protein